MKVSYTCSPLVEEVWESVECDTYKHEIHPVTGLVTLSAYKRASTTVSMTRCVAAVREFRVFT